MISVWLLLFGLVLLKTTEVFIVANEVVGMNSLSNIIIKWIFVYGVSCVDFHTCSFLVLKSQCLYLFNS